MAVVPVMIASALEIIWEESIILEKRIVLRLVLLSGRAASINLALVGKHDPVLSRLRSFRLISGILKSKSKSYIIRTRERVNKLQDHRNSQWKKI